jgi:hypothetical protein
MSNLEELRVSAERLCASLDEAANNEKKFCHNVLNELERMSWEALRISNDIKEIMEYQGV